MNKIICADRRISRCANFAILLALAAILAGCGDSGDEASNSSEGEITLAQEADTPLDSDAALDAISDISSMRGMEYSRRAPILSAQDQQVAQLPCPNKVAERLVEFHASRGGKTNLLVWEACTLIGKDKEVIKGKGPLLYRVEKLNDTLYMLYSTLSDSPKDEKKFSFVITDGKTIRRVVEFSAMPSNRVIMRIMEATKDSVALNDLAAMIFNGDENCRTADKEYCEKLLQNAALDGEWMACRNLAFLYKLDREKDHSHYWADLAEKVFQRSIPGEIRKPMKKIPVSAWPIMSEALGF